MIPKQGPVIAIDGPAGAGKSTITKALADRLNFIHVDTGALYRAVAYACIENKIYSAQIKDLTDVIKERVTELTKSLHLEFIRDPKMTPSNRVLMNGRDITIQIRTPEISMAASKISSFPGVRAALLGFQRKLGCVGRALLEGRDIGTVIFPDADVKFFMTATSDERAQRRYNELKEKNGTHNIPNLSEIKNQIEKRDHDDMNRQVAPLKKAQDAIEIDTTHLSIHEVIDKMFNIVISKIGKYES